MPIISAIPFPALILNRVDTNAVIVEAMNEGFRSRSMASWSPSLEKPVTVREVFDIKLARRMEDIILIVDETGQPVRDSLKLKNGETSQIWHYSCGYMKLTESYLFLVTEIEEPDVRSEIFRAEAEAVHNTSLLTDLVQNSFVVLDPALKIARISVSLRGFLDRTEESLLGTYFFELVAASQRNSLEQAVEDVTSGKSQGATRVASLRSKTGELRTFILGITTSGDAALQHTVLSVVDATGIRQSIIELKQAKQEAEKANKVKTNFLSQMSHEMKTPLNGIIGFAEIINQQILGPIDVPQYVEYARDISFSANHLSQVVSDVLEMARIESGKLELDDEPFTLNDLLSELESETASIVQQHRKRISYSCHPMTAIKADRHIVKQVLTNLILNAVKYSDTHGLSTIECMTMANGDLAIVVSDGGEGIDSSKVRDLLTPYVSVKVKPGRATQLGTGLGVPLARGFMELHGGRLFINSELGSGTSVFAVFPRERVIYSEANDISNYHGIKMKAFQYDAAKLSDLIDTFTPEEFDSLPYGVIKLDREGVILAYNAVEGKFSGLLAEEVVGRNYFTDVAPCTQLTEFHKKYVEGMEGGDLNEYFDFVFNFPQRPMNVQIHLKQSQSHDGGWAFVHWI